LQSVTAPSGLRGGAARDFSREVILTKEWSNWSGSLRFTPARIFEPRDEEGVARAVREAAEVGSTLRVVGAGHSSSPLVKTSETLVSLERLQGLVSHDTARGEATVRAGMVIKDVGKALFDVGLAMHNTGDVDVQTLAGAIGTGTHGTGRTLGNFSTMLIGGRLVTGTGDVLELSSERDPELVSAARVALGMFGIFTELRVRLLPAFRLHRREWCTHIDACIAHLGELAEGNRNFDFHWYPRSDEAKLRTMNEPGQGPSDVPFARCVRDVTGWSHEVLPRTRHLRFDEIEYALPAQAGPACFRDVRERVKARWRREVAWRVLYRTIAADDGWLSPMHARDSVTISLHHNAGLPYQEYFQDIEPIFRAHGGRPHWGKKHTMTAATLQLLYPLWERFQETRRRLDPTGVFLTPELASLLGADVTSRVG
jgi:FAD/FMN-containing dehydrogenase